MNKALRPTITSTSANRPMPLADSAALDQWRGLALLLVLISHGFLFTGRVDGVGRVGVNLFFFISGLLVFRSLNKPRDYSYLRRSISFWKRRFLRLYPALLAYLVALLPVLYVLDLFGLTQSHGHLREVFPAMIYAVTYTTNYSPTENPLIIAHLWSLSCEMQFYLVSPLIFALGGTRPSRRLFVWGGLLLILMISGALQPLFGIDHRKYRFEYAVWPMMLGFYCEWLKNRVKELPPRLLENIRRAGALTVLLALVVTAFHPMTKTLVIIAGTFALVPCFLSYVFGRAMKGAHGAILLWLGQRTYSIYLWQQPFTICAYLPTYLYALGALFSNAIGAIWFRFFEKPFLSSARSRKIEPVPGLTQKYAAP